MAQLPKLNTNTDSFKSSKSRTNTPQLNSAGSSLFPEVNSAQFNPQSHNYIPLTPSISPSEINHRGFHYKWVMVLDNVNWSRGLLFLLLLFCCVYVFLRSELDSCHFLKSLLFFAIYSTGGHSFIHLVYEEHFFFGGIRFSLTGLWVFYASLFLHFCLFYFWIFWLIIIISCSTLCFAFYCY